jgi:hypothetical protein
VALGKRLAWRWLAVVCSLLAPDSATAWTALTTDEAYCGEALPLRWARNPIPWYLSAAGTDDLTIDEVEAAALAAFQAWEDVPGAYVRFEYRGRLDETSAVAASGDSLVPDPVRYSPFRPVRILVSFQRADWPETLWGARGITFPVTYGCDGEFLFTDIVMNDTYTDWHVGDTIPSCPSCFDLQGLLTHEVGHLLGLGHSDVAGATMTTCDEHVTSGCDCVRAGHTCAQTLEADDAAGLSFLYPADEAPPDSTLDGLVGGPCASAGDCASEVCLRGGGRAICTDLCTTPLDCPRGLTCHHPWGDNPFDDSVCWFGAGAAGDPCAAGCASGRCLAPPDERCTASCSGDGDCPAEWMCRPDGWCAPAAASEPSAEAPAEPQDGGGDASGEADEDAPDDTLEAADAGGDGAGAEGCGCAAAGGDAAGGSLFAAGCWLLFARRRRLSFRQTPLPA